LDLNKLSPEFFTLIIKVLGKVLALSIVVAVGILSARVIQEFGPTHSLSVFGVGTFFCLLFIAIDNLFSTSVSNLQWAAFAVNILLLIYTFLLLPTNEAIQTLNELEVEQNFWELLKSWWSNLE
jgi:hypothetical protein